jgi:hypothetical protein
VQVSAAVLLSAGDCAEALPARGTGKAEASATRLERAINKLDINGPCQCLTDALCMSERANERRQAQA